MRKTRVRKRQRKKNEKKELVRQQRWNAFTQELGRIFADSIIHTLRRPSFTELILGGDEAWIAWENEWHPWWTRTVRRTPRPRGELA